MKNDRVKAFFALGGILFFLVILMLDVAMTLLDPASFLVSSGFHQMMKPYAAIMGAWVGVSVLTGLVILSKSIEKARGRTMMLGIGIFASVLLAGLAYLLTIDIAARLLHSQAPRQCIVLTAKAVSVYRPRRELRCDWHLKFEAEEIQSDIPLSSYVCITWEQRRNLFSYLPKTIILHGDRSVYGYRLWLYGVK